MRRATITLSDDLQARVEAYLAGQESPPSLSSLIRMALARFLGDERLATTQPHAARRPRGTASATARPETRSTLDELLAAVTAENRHAEIDTGPAVGKEVW